MGFHVVEKLTFSRRQKVVDWFHVDMFHGGETLPFRNDDPRVLPPPRPLRLWKNVYRIADVFEPATACRLIVSGEVRGRLDGF
jgi:hypothetical protein